ncbi:hypothetical protein D5086_020800 [Populus alba]|uniref:Uncharacterized protein n=1 Tax=Populus alba TaxID=43335 RepID=A0ACC4BLN9_POPAL
MLHRTPRCWGGKANCLESTLPRPVELDITWTVILEVHSQISIQLLTKSRENAGSNISLTNQIRTLLRRAWQVAVPARADLLVNKGADQVISSVVCFAEPPHWQVEMFMG